MGVNWCAAAFGYLTSVLSPPALAQLLGVVAIFANAQFAGGAPTLIEMAGKVPPLCWLPAVSFARYALEALYVAEVAEFQQAVAVQGVDLTQLLRNNFGYDIAAYGKDVAILFGIGLVVRVGKVGVQSPQFGQVSVADWQALSFPRLPRK